MMSTLGRWAAGRHRSRELLVTDSVHWVRAEGGVAVVSHPFQVSHHGVRKRDFVLRTASRCSMTGR